MSDQEIISPNNSDTISSTQVIKNKNKGNINFRGLLVDPIPNSPK